MVSIVTKFLFFVRAFSRGIWRLVSEQYVNRTSCLHSWRKFQYEHDVRFITRMTEDLLSFGSIGSIWIGISLTMAQRIGHHRHRTSTRCITKWRVTWSVSCTRENWTREKVKNGKWSGVQRSDVKCSAVKWNEVMILVKCVYYPLIYSYVAVCMFCAVGCVIVICFSLLFSNHSTYDS